MATSIISPTAIALLCFFFVALYAAGGHAEGKNQASTAGDVYDVTEYGAKTSNSDNKDAFLAAWRAACGSTGGGGNATLLFPNGTFAVGAVEFAGPCRNVGFLAVVIDGVLQPGGCRLSDDDAWITFSGVNNLVVTGAGTLDGQGDQSDKWKSKPTTLLLEDVTNSSVRDLRFINSRGFHVNLRHCTHVTATGLHIRAAAESRNTDGIHVGLSAHVRILDSTIGTGDDCVSVGPGSTDVVVHGVVCGPGHGISVGSLGKEDGDEEDVRGLVVRNCTVAGTTNGVRIKTWPGSPPSRASNITFEDITMADVANPIIIDQQYCPHGRCAGAGKPSLVQISDVTFSQIQGTSSSRIAVQLLCSEERPCLDVRLVNISLTCGDRPCGTEIVHVQAAPPSPAPAAPAPARLVDVEEEADQASGILEQLHGQ
ncbi:hypothetical protein PR202_gb02455 [Eleusine coracana subsp. coracana]|uniref:Exopolygalacturonase n=1 Tax=Eleusine coracana subsp. coracana TaxID=191504 RepID=A0AAV5DXT6_ELECO|nr:hypothetical protein PR202_gb02455 [Eleusine coracana subsp. coracana]